ncbi:Chaperone protein EcpD precursor [compost metagenome]
MYWFNVLDIPPELNEQDTNKLQLAFRSRIKIFLRPPQLTEAVEDAPAKLSWKVSGRDSIAIHNGSKFHITFSSASIKGPSQELVFDDQSMVAPGQTMTVRLKQGTATVGDPVNFSIINDYGGQTKGESVLR